MYSDYYGLNQPPFKITPDTRLFFPGGNRGAVLDALVYAITSGEGIVKVVGEVGSGKTMLCRMLEQELPANVEIVYLAIPSLAPENIQHAIAFELKLPVTSDDSRLKVMNILQDYLLQRHAENSQVVVFVEEAQGMPIATLEEIRLLSNLETKQNKLLQIVLFGQPELDQMIAKKEIRQLKERITYSFQLQPFKQDDIKDYLNARLRSCGYRAGELFNSSAVKTIEHFSRGLLRRINILADKAMLAAYAGNTNKVTAKHVRLAARDSEFITDWSPFNITVPLFALLLIAIVFWFSQQGGMMLSIPAEDSDNTRRVNTDNTGILIDEAVGMPSDNPVTSLPGQALSDIEAESDADAEIVTGDIQSVDVDIPASEVIHENVQEHLVIYFDQYDEFQAYITMAGIEQDEIDSEKTAENIPATAIWEEETIEFQDEIHSTAIFEGNSDFAGQLLDVTNLFELQDNTGSRITYGEPALLQRSEALSHPTFD
jgi:type II secretory pathway predicted ATPase ExeA